MLDFIGDGFILLAQFIRNAGPNKDKPKDIKPVATVQKKAPVPPAPKK